MYGTSRLLERSLVKWVSLYGSLTVLSAIFVWRAAFAIPAPFVN